VHSQRRASARPLNKWVCEPRRVIRKLVCLLLRIIRRRSSSEELDVPIMLVRADGCPLDVGHKWILLSLCSPKSSGAWGQLDGLAVRGVSIGLGPRFPARE